jgi:fatty acid amide hydrolase
MTTLPTLAISMLSILVVAWWWNDTEDEIVQQKRAEQARIRQQWLSREAPPPLPAERCVLALREQLRQGTVRPTDVTEHAIRKACVAGAAYCCVTEQPFEEAMRRAAALQCRPAGPEGLLWGLPVTVKDSVHMAGYDSSCGTTARCGRPQEEDGDIVSAIYRLGGVVVAKSNVPQMMMLPESSNRIWGTAKNPWNPARTPGGSTGGEGVLLAVGVSALGIGTDIGGSLRIPAVWCGVCGFLPTPRRLSHRGAATISASGFCGNDVIVPSIGPMARTVEGLALGMEALSAVESSDRTHRRQPWCADKVTTWSTARKVRVGWAESCSFFETCPTARRAVRESVQRLRQAGHDVVELPPIPMERIVELYYGILSAEGGMRSYREALQGEKLAPAYRSLLRMASVPAALRPVLAALLPPRMALLLRCTGGKTAYEFFQWVEALQQLRQQLLAEWFGKADVLLTPGPALPALPHGMSKELTPSFCYTFMANVLQMPTAVIPTTVVHADECTYVSAHRDRYTTLAQESMAGAAGMPMGVQVSAAPHMDEMCIGMALQLQRLHPPFPAPPS